MNMIYFIRNHVSYTAALLILTMSVGCSTFETAKHNHKGADSCTSCTTGCDSCPDGGCSKCGNNCKRYRGNFVTRCRARCCGWFRSHAIPDTLPLGSTIRAHYQVMETNAEAVDFILYQKDFVDNTAELTPLAKDKILEIGARMRSTPFPVIVERSENNSDPELDAFRRNLVAIILADLGNPDADQRVIVAPAYGPGLNSVEGEINYYQNVLSGLGGGGLGNGGFGAGGAGFNGGGF